MINTFLLQNLLVRINEIYVHLKSLTSRSQKVFEENVNLLVRFWSWRMTLAVGHGNPIRIPEKPVDCNRMIKSFPALRLIFRAA
jgi:hypothetical protein